jgi:hypothetical protein
MPDAPQHTLELIEAAASCINVFREVNKCPSLSLSLSELALKCASVISTLQKLPPLTNVSLQTPPDSTSTTPSIPGPPRLPELVLPSPLNLSPGDLGTEGLALDSRDCDKESHSFESTSQLSTAMNPFRCPGNEEPPQPTQNQAGQDWQTDGQALHTDMPLPEVHWLSAQFQPTSSGIGQTLSQPAPLDNYSSSFGHMDYFGPQIWGPESGIGGCLGDLSETNFLSTVTETCCPADLIAVPPATEVDLANTAVQTTRSDSRETVSTCVSADSKEQASLGQPQQVGTSADCSATESAASRKRPCNSDKLSPKRRKVPLKAARVKQPGSS